MAEEPMICEPGGKGYVFPFEHEQTWAPVFRVVVYAAALIYLFLGISMVADKFVGSIEVITSRRKRVKDRSSGRYMTVAVWNDTVANLTLMALGSSAPEILLSVVEIVGGGFHAGELGPSTIVGSAAFNLFVIVGTCIMAVPSTELRRIQEHGVFIVTAAFSLFAYLWLVFIVSVSSPDVVTIWEGILTLLLFPVLTLLSYGADVGWFSSHPESEGLAGSGVGPLPPPPSAIQDVRGMPVAPPPCPWPQPLAGTSVQPGMPPAYFGAAGPSLGSGAPAEASTMAGSVHGVLAFPEDTLEVASGLAQQQFQVPVLRVGGCSGEVSCSYRMQRLTAVPGYDYIEASGELNFGNGVNHAEILLTVLPKRLGEHSDQFQVILEDVKGGAEFDSSSDGGKERSILTVTISNSTDVFTGHITSMRLSRAIDGALNMDSIREGSASWCSEIKDSVASPSTQDEPATAASCLMHFVALPWKLMFAILIPPPVYCGGWLCFTASLVLIGGLTAIVADFAELLGCVTGMGDAITAISIVALGTSMPDLFASMASAAQDETADASIVNVTGSNSVNVFLGIGLPWTLAAIYWQINGKTEEWTAKYGFRFGADYDGPAVFVVRGGDLAFSVVVFTIAACVCLVVLHLRRIKLGGELGGPFVPQAMSAAILVLLWIFYIGLSVWKVKASPSSDSIGAQLIAIFVGICVLENVLLIIGGVVLCVHGRGNTSLTKEVDLERDGIAGDADCPKCPPPLPAPAEMPDFGVNLRHAAAALPAPVAPWAGAAQITAQEGAMVVGRPCLQRDKSRTDGAFARMALVCLAAKRLRRGKGRTLLWPQGAAAAQLDGYIPRFERAPSFHSLPELPDDCGALPTTACTHPPLASVDEAGRHRSTGVMVARGVANAVAHLTSPWADASDSAQPPFATAREETDLLRSRAGF